MDLNPVILLMGPTLKGFEVADKLQLGLALFLEKRFAGRLLIKRVDMDLSAVTPPQLKRMAEREVAKVVATAREDRKLILIDCPAINFPKQVARTALNPITVFIKIGNSKVLEKLIKTRGKAGRSGVTAQIDAAHKYLHLPPDSFTVTLTESVFDDASKTLAAFLEAFWAKKFPSLSHMAHPEPRVDLNDKEKGLKIASGIANAVESVATLALKLKSVKSIDEGGGSIGGVNVKDQEKPEEGKSVTFEDDAK